MKTNKGRFKKGLIPWNKGIKLPYQTWITGKHHSKKSKEKMREKHLGKKLSKKQCDEMSLRMMGNTQGFKKGQKPWNTGLKMSKEYRLKMIGKKKLKRTIDAQGYVRIWDVQKQAYDLEHRKIMKDFLGRPLTRNELVHHRNGIRTDNRIQNLRIQVRKHHGETIQCPFCKKEFDLK